MADVSDHHSESEDDFRPQTHVESDDEDVQAKPRSKPRVASEHTSDVDDEHVDAKPSKKLGRRPRPVEDDDEDDEKRQPDQDEDEEGEGEDLGDGEDDEDEEDDEEDEVEDRPRKRHKRDRLRNQFIDIEVEVDDEEEDEELEEDDLPYETHPDDLLDIPDGAATDDRRHRELDRQRELAASMDAEKQAEALREKYGRNRSRLGADVSAVPQHYLLPSVNDPMIWAVRCKEGKENEIVAAIWKRVEGRSRTKDPLRLISAFARGGTTMKNYIYVEARTLQDVYAATEDVAGCYPHGPAGCKIIPINERPDTLRVQKPKTLEPGMYVRIKRPVKYAGDLGLVESVDTNGIDVSVKIIPRLDYGNDDDLTFGAVKRKRPMAARPPQRLFSEVEARKKMGKSLLTQASLSHKHFQFQGEQFVDGFLLKDMRVSNLQTDNVNPTLDEVTRFAAGGENGAESLDLAQLHATIKSSTSASDFLPGDNVEIYQGEQSGVKGKAVSVTNEIVTIQVSEGPLKGQNVESPVKDLRKLFKEGDHVKVIGGSKYFDEVGMVVRIRDVRVTLVTDSNNQEITVFSKDLREASDSSGSRTTMKHKYDLHDLVQLDAATVGCCVKVDRESIRVLDQNGSVRTLLPSQIANKIDRRRMAVATDRDGAEIKTDDGVKENGGESRSGRVLHIHRNYLFVLDRNQAANTGVFVVRSSNVNNTGVQKSNGTDLSKMNPALLRPNAGAPMGMGPPRAMGRDRMISKTVRIRLGPYKGLIGIVKDATETDARVELHTKNKVVSIPKQNLITIDPNTGQEMGRGGAPGSMRTGGVSLPSRTPMSRVPEGMGGSRTPMAASGSRTPWGAGADSGSKTPSWGRSQGWGRPNDGSQTAYGDGSRTSYGGATAYGGAGNYYAGSRTPAGAGQTSRTPYNAPTPGGYGSAPTPGASGSYNSAPTPYDSAPTPRIYDSAPTPGGGLSAPTPGADGPTPRYPYATPAGSAMTPAAYPETPGAYAAETPAAFAGGDDDGPRYD